MHVDYLIVGQGLCGSFLSHYLIKEGKQVVVIDAGLANTASKIASGIINPVTGRRIVKTWMIDEILPFAYNAYNAIAKENEIELIKSCSIIDIHTTPQMKEAFEKRLHENADYLKAGNEKENSTFFKYYFGTGEISPCFLVDINYFLEITRKTLLQKNVLINEVFNLSECEINNDKIYYKNITAEKIIFCDGVQALNNRFFRKLPFALNKGEVLIAAIPDLPRNNIFKYGITLVPWKDNLFWIGSSYEWNFEDNKPTSQFREKTIHILKNILHIPFEITEHLAAVRPANIERRPFAGLHTVYTNVGILNGMGTKGVSLAPFFAHQFAQHLCYQKNILPEADIKRFKKILGD